jgi:hypothetical protein
MTLFYQPHMARHVPDTVETRRESGAIGEGENVVKQRVGVTKAGAAGRVFLLGIGLFALPTSASAREGRQEGWTRLLRVTRPQEAAQVFQSLFGQARRNGVDAAFAAASLKGLSGHLDRQAAAGATPTLCFGLVGEALEAAYHAKLPVAESVDLLVALQRDMDATPRPSYAAFQETLRSVRAGAYSGRPETDQLAVAAAVGTRGR